jgi:hypothetical protein
MRPHLRSLFLSAAAVAGAMVLTIPTAASSVSRPPTGPPSPPALSADSGHNLYDVGMISADDAWSVGSRTEGSATLTWVRHWNGTAWKQAPSPSPGSQENLLRSVATISASDVWAVGGQENIGDSDERPLVEHWDGTSWSVVDQPADSGRAYGVSASGPDDVWVVGDRYQNPIAEHWDGTTWADTTLELPPATPPYQVTLMLPYDVVALSRHNAWLIDIYDEQNGSGGYKREILAEHWDGTAWRFVFVPRGAAWTYLFEIRATSAHDVWAVGATEFRERAFIAHYDGNTWTSTTQTLYDGQSALLTGVSAIAPDDVWAVGYHGNNKHGIDRYHPFAERWDGSQWTVDESVDPHADTASLAAVGAAATDDVFAVGNLVNNDKTRALIEHWDGTRWQRVR